MKHSMMLRAGLGEEVLKSFRQEKQITKLAKEIEKMTEENLDYEEMARRIVSNLIKDKKYE